MGANLKPTAVNIAKFYRVSRETVRNYRDGNIEKQRLYNAMREYFIKEAIKELELLDNDLKDLFSCIELTEDENAEKRLSSMETYLIRLSKYIK